VRRELKVLQREFGYTTIVVTHDQLEALSLADRMAVMDAGTIQQFGTPDEVFDDPANQFVADFVGEPKINLVDGVVSRPSGGAPSVRIGAGGALPIVAAGPADGTKVVVGFRPQDTLSPEESPGGSADGAGVEADVVVFENLLEHGLATVSVDGLDATVVAQTPADRLLSRGDRLVLTAPAERVYLFDPDTGQRLR
jgi:multiple sugar transport system ATP-binding protein